MDYLGSKELVSPPKAWWSRETVAVVTGANRGIGHALAARLAELGLTVVLTARDATRGEAAAAALVARGLPVLFRRLDVADAASVAAFASWLRDDLDGLDILVNNAAVSFNEIDTNSVEHAETVLWTNFYGPKMLTEALLPLFRRSLSTSRILNISSQLGLLNWWTTRRENQLMMVALRNIFILSCCGQQILMDPAQEREFLSIQKLEKVSNSSLKTLLQEEEKLTEAKIDEMVSRFLRQVKDGTWQEQGWPKVWTDYSVSKLALNAYSRLLSRRLDGDRVSVNCFCPGFTRTDMTRGWGKRTAEEAAEVGTRLALLPPGELPTGTFFKWCTPQLYSRL